MTFYLDRPHYVYRAFDAHGLLLYVGCSMDVEKRLLAHRAGPWHRYLETLMVDGPWERTEALAVERAINTEVPFFNSSMANMVADRANSRAAEDTAAAAGWERPPFDESRPDPEYGAEYERLFHAWHRELERQRVLLRQSGAFPYITEQNRLDAYLAARRDAESCEHESDAA